MVWLLMCVVWDSGRGQELVIGAGTLLSRRYSGVQP